MKVIWSHVMSVELQKQFANRALQNNIIGIRGLAVVERGSMSTHVTGNRVCDWDDGSVCIIPILVGAQFASTVRLVSDSILDVVATLAVD